MVEIWDGTQTEYLMMTKRLLPIYPCSIATSLPTQLCYGTSMRTFVQPSQIHNISGRSPIHSLLCKQAFIVCGGPLIVQEDERPHS